jgi:hypothetical protein
MPLIVGLIVTPIGAIVATLTFALVLLIAHDAFGAWAFSADMAVTILAIAFTYGLLFAAPVTLVALPLTYGRLRRRDSLSRRRMAVAGMAFAVLLVWGIVGTIEISSGRFDFFSRKAQYFTLIGAMTGLVVSFAFAYIMQWKRPADWPSPAESAETSR